MDGLEIRPDRSAGRLSRVIEIAPPGPRPFETFFGPILPRLAAFHWLYDEFPFAGWEDDDPEFMRLCDARCDEGYLPPDTLLPKFARYVINDWADLYGFAQRPPEDVRRRLGARRQADYRWLSGIVDICFFNVDGAYWEIYAADDRILNEVAAHVAQLTHATAAEKRLEERDRRL
jgi:hypothetical protein